ncbi:MAG: YHS domain-containing (seleno)protein [Pseudomonadota bacterium]
MKILLGSFAYLFAIALIAPAYAGEQYVDKTGYAVSGYDVVSYYSIKQSAIGQLQRSPLPGKKSITVKFNNATWAFATEQNRDLFLKNPTKYVPAYDGHCAYGNAQGYKVPANPKLWRIVDGRLYLNIRRSVFNRWHRDISGYINKGDNNWGRLQSTPASNNSVPELNASRAPI